MRSSRALAVVRSPESVRRIPQASWVLPLSPRVRAPPDRLVAHRPEDLLNEADFREIESRAREVAQGWWEATPPSAFTWRKLNVASCFTYELRFVARDVLKASWILKAAIERSGAGALVTDVPPLHDVIPPYPYMSAVGSILEDLASSSGLRLERLDATEAASRPPRSRALIKAYATVAARQAMPRLRAGRLIVGIGPFPDSYGPIAREWSKRQGSMVVASSIRAPLRANASVGLYFVPFEAFVSRDDRDEMQSFIAAAVNSTPAALPPHLRFDALDGWEKVFLGDVRRRLQRDLPILACLRVAFGRGLEKAARLLLMETLSPASKAAVACARDSGIPVVVLQHGVIANAAVHRETDAECIASWGTLDAAWFSSNLARSTRVEPTGNPRYDDLSVPRKRPVHPALRGIPAGSRILLFASSPFGHAVATDSLWNHDALQSAAVDAIRRIKEAYLLFKRHPAERPGPLPGTSSGSDERVKEVVGGDTFSLIRASEVVLSMGSTVALEAMILDRPVIFLGPPHPDSPFHPPEDGGGLRALRGDDLGGFVSRLMADARFRAETLRGQREYLRRYYTPVDGHAADRVVEFLIRG